MIGGEIFVASRQNDVKKVETDIYFFTGICQNKQGQWESLSDNKLIDFEADWSIQPPKKTSGERQCLLYDIENEKLVGQNPTNFPVVCEMPHKPVKFFLRGVCMLYCGVFMYHG